MTATGPLIRVSVLAVLCAFVPSSGAEKADAVISFQVTTGACGSVTFVRKVANDYDSAISEMQRSLSISNPPEQCTVKAGCRLEPFEIGVAGSPGRRFYALRVVDTQTGRQAHGVSQVVTSDGQLFNLRWCPD